MILVVLSLKPTKSVLNGKEINLTAGNTTIKSNNFNVDKNGNMECANAQITNGSIELTSEGQAQPKIKIYKPSSDIQTILSSYHIAVTDGYAGTQMNPLFLWARSNSGEETIHGGGYSYYRIGNEIYTEISTNGITTPVLTQTSKAEVKKNFEKLKNALDIVKATDIYKYNLKGEEDTAKKHIGFVIGDNYNYSEEITSKNNDGVDIYSMVSVCMKAIQEQQEIIEKLQQEIKELKGDK